MHVRLICPAPPRTLYGNRITALRWARLIRGLSHRVTISEHYEDEPCDVLVALHARRSAEAVFRSRAADPARPVVVALTGTDVYRDLPKSRLAQKALEAADRIVALQPLALERLAPAMREKGTVIYQSAEKTRGRAKSDSETFLVAVVGHLRAVKDPFRAAYASRGLPAASRIRVLHLGSAMDERMERAARVEERRNPRYRWLGGVPVARTRRTIASSRLVVLSSKMEGGANVISEAAVDGVPVLSSRIAGSVGLLGEDYPGYFPVGDTEALAGLLLRAETDPVFYGELKRRCARLAPLFSPARERDAWRQLLASLRNSSGPCGIK